MINRGERGQGGCEPSPNVRNYFDVSNGSSNIVFGLGLAIPTLHIREQSCTLLSSDEIISFV